jgi:hypothetical protein
VTAGRTRRANRPLYARVLRLHRLRPGPLLCFMFFEGTIALGILLALAELASEWVVLVLPLSVAAMVKFNDVVAVALARSSVPAIPAARRGQAAFVGAALDAGPPFDPVVEPQRSARERFSSTRQAEGLGAPVEDESHQRGTVYGSPVRGTVYGSDARGLEGGDDQADTEPGAAEWVGSPEQRARQSGSRRYERHE